MKNSRTTTNSILMTRFLFSRLFSAFDLDQVRRRTRKCNCVNCHGCHSTSTRKLIPSQGRHMNLHRLVLDEGRFLRAVVKLVERRVRVARVLLTLAQLGASTPRSAVAYVNLDGIFRWFDRKIWKISWIFRLILIMLGKSVALGVDSISVNGKMCGSGSKRGQLSVEFN